MHNHGSGAWRCPVALGRHPLHAAVAPHSGRRCCPARLGSRGAHSPLLLTLVPTLIQALVAVHQVPCTARSRCPV